MSPSNVRIRLKFLQLLKYLREWKFRCQITTVVHQGRAIQQRRNSNLLKELLIVLKVGKHLIDRRQSFFSLQERLQVKLFPVLIPLLVPIIMFSEKMRANLMIHHALNGLLPVMNRQPNHHLTVRLLVVMHHTRRRYRVLCKLIRQQISYLQLFQILVKRLWSLLDCQRFGLCEKFVHLDFFGLL